MAAILQAAACLFMEKGYHSASMQDVAKAAGLTKGGLYHHFPSKEAIRDALLEQFLSVERLGLNDLKTEDLSANQKLLRAGELLLEGLATKNGSAPRFMAEAVACSGHIDAVSRYYKEVEALLATIIDEGVKDGSFRASGDACTVSRQYLALLDGLQLRRDMFGDGQDNDVLSSFVATLSQN